MLSRQRARRTRAARRVTRRRRRRVRIGRVGGSILHCTRGRRLPSACDDFAERSTACSVRRRLSGQGVERLCPIAAAVSALSQSLWPPHRPQRTADRRRRRRPHRHLGLALCACAAPSTTRGSGPRASSAASRQLSTIEITARLFAAAAVELGRVDETRTTFLFIVQGQSLHHAHDEAARYRGADGEPLTSRPGLLRLGRISPGAVAVPPNSRSIRRLRAVSRDPAVRQRPGAAHRRAPLPPRRRRSGSSSMRCASIRHSVEVRTQLRRPDFIALRRRTASRSSSPTTTPLPRRRPQRRLRYVLCTARRRFTERVQRGRARLFRRASRPWRTGGPPRFTPDRVAPPRMPSGARVRYFDNTDKLEAPIDAKRLIARLHANTRVPMKDRAGFRRVSARCPRHACRTAASLSATHIRICRPAPCPRPNRRRPRLRCLRHPSSTSITIAEASTRGGSPSCRLSRFRSIRFRRCDASGAAVSATTCQR